ncbi:tripartite tricarboxylate transporter substrate binding protein [Caenimonas sedimenti]|uniref:Tripartite tricarboxylate transporter substrate binding protein n=1 Tax=Caenimonas sedimenti TaxID=2596921 RepID=A0A562ZQM2_9BURK|nr:tripartite tricarboxylate transporter substrate binding protein [Caenimonas sedimenti]TWO70687.1 tripartite tricarboxylate transporter substrate binding protein [Caenimonas sedimenti]
MKPSIPFARRGVFKAAFGVIAAFAAQAAFAQSWPARPITLVVPFATGGTTDVLARAVGQELSTALGQPVVIESKPGAGATLGADYVAKARPDGYTFLMGAVHHTIATSVYKKLPYDFQKDLAPVSVVALVPNVLVVHPNVAAKSVAEIVALAKASPGKLTYGSNGNGTGQHLIGAQFEGMAGIDLLHVPYKGSGPLTTDLLGGQIAMSFDTITPVLPHIKAGKLRALAITTNKRSVALPDVPTLDEAGLKGFNLGTWFGVLAPAATPAPIIDRVSKEIQRIVNQPEFKKKMEELGAETIGSTPVQMARQIKDDTERFARLVKDAKVTIE